ncbi:ankyrin repeat domain-containing protein 17-like isoform X2 [Salvia splendens]|uniref:ankyrin repeat domain-containing protein 17-like isoform X2 n=1 Tax=Salvia splendens TaxID=180675 RepID=UPI001C25F945|nr:ankyrin repeat domain-containing protein 17-like isoform X2 [Salvia splendens]
MAQCALIIEAGASGDLKKLKEIRRKVNDEFEFRRICEGYSDFSAGRNVLHHAAHFGHFHVCKFLIQTLHVYIDPLTYNMDTPLLEAAKEGHVKIVEYLIRQGAGVSEANLKGTTALHYAILNGNKELMELVVAKGIRVDADSRDGTSLQIASSRGDVWAVKFLLSRDAKPDLCFLVPEPPLVCAVTARSFECLELLLKAKADPNKYFSGFGPLSYAAREADTRFLKALLEADADPDEPKIGHVKVIEDAALSKNLKALEILLPVTTVLKHYPEWTVDGIMEYCHSKQAQAERDDDKDACLVALSKGAGICISIKKYSNAITHFKTAHRLDPYNPKWLSNQSLCHAREDRCTLTLHSANECVRLSPRFPSPYPGDARAAAKIIYRFFIAGIAFMLEPGDKHKDDKFRLAFYDYFALMYLMSTPEEIARFTTVASKS